jgi:hypothetical protein
MIGKIFITRSGYDPQLGKHVKDPYLGETPTLGACRPDVRRKLSKGDHIFVISGKVPDAPQFVMGGFEIEEKVSALDAYRLFPDLRLRRLEDGQLTGNIIVDSQGRQHPLDNHDGFDRRIENYVIGRDLVSLTTDDEIALGRDETLDVLRDVLRRNGRKPVEVVGRWGCNLTEDEIMQLREWLQRIKKGGEGTG